MHFCYIDESGTSSIPGNTSHFILAGLSIPVENWKACDEEISKLKDTWNLSGSEIHTAWMLRKYIEQSKIPNFEKLDYSQRRNQINSYRKAELLRLQRVNPKLYRQIKKNYRHTESYIHLTLNERMKIIYKIADIISKWDFARLFAECIDKIYFDPSISIQSVDEQAFEQVVSRFEQYLQVTSGKSKNIGIIIHDNNQTIAKNLTELMISFHKKGTLWTKVTNIIETPLFVDSQLTSMVQLADLCSYSIRRFLENGETALFNKIIKRADRKDGKIVGVRHFS
jgi:Protein of unknown function (DUF3800)